jgi:hypothetical protein
MNSLLLPGWTGIGMVRIEHLLFDRQRSPVARLGVGAATLAVVD